MCSVCGCGEGDVRIDGTAAVHHHHRHGSDDHHAHHSNGAHDLDFRIEAADGHEHGLEHGSDRPGRLLRIEQNILAKNDGFAAGNRERLNGAGVLTLNLVSSPGAGKTTLLTATISALSGDMRVAVIEGDQETANDAERIRETGVPAVQINTGRGCHLDAHMVAHALDSLTLEDGSVLFIENVGNLVCPAAFDLGEHHKVAILSVTEGEDKPLKYPDMFAASDLMILSKIDLLPYVDFDVVRCVEYARRINPDIHVLQLSATKGEGMAAWTAWIDEARSRVGQNAKMAAPSLARVVDHA
jgi:hydrogenase nickel incorporation protein HypB